MKKFVQLQHGIRVRVGGAPAESAPMAAVARVDAIGCAAAVVGLAPGLVLRVPSVAIGALLTAGWLLYSFSHRPVLARSLSCGAIVQWAIADAEEGILRAFLSPDVVRVIPAAGAADAEFVDAAHPPAPATTIQPH